MWIPKHAAPDNQNIVVAITTAAKALTLAGGVKDELHATYMRIMNIPRNVRTNIEVCTNPGKGQGFVITPAEAYYLNELGMLSDEIKRTDHDCGLTDYSRTTFWRVLDLIKLYAYLDDQSLPAPAKLE